MKKLILLILLASYCSCTLAQDCYRAVRVNEYKKHLIKEVCIPKDYWISYLRTRLTDVDIDADSINDFIFDWNRQNLEDGDSLFITVYKQYPDSTYKLFKTLKNLLPIFLKSYDDPSKDSLSANIFECYGEGYPLRDLKFGTGIIELTIRLDALSSYFLKYSYDSGKKNWYLVTYEQWIEYPEKKQIIRHPILKPAESIDQFSYQKYLCPDLFPAKK